MQVGHGPVQTLCTARAQRVHGTQYAPPPGGGGLPVKEAGTHSPPCPQYLPNIKPHAMHQIVKGSPLLPHKISAWPSLLQLLPQLLQSPGFTPELQV